ncbi:unnamed protein product [Ectocarpus fasciculatus]
MCMVHKCVVACLSLVVWRKCVLQINEIVFPNALKTRLRSSKFKASNKEMYTNFIRFARDLVVFFVVLLGVFVVPVCCCWWFVCGFVGTNERRGFTIRLPS